MLARRSNADLVATAAALASDGVCAEVVSAWRAQQIEPVLLKGPTVAEWLYPDAARGYADVDLLVAPQHVLVAAETLRRLGFAPVSDHVSLHAHPWIRSTDGAQVDLHVTLWGAHRPAAHVWRELQQWLESRRVGPVSVRVLRIPARALHVVLHAAQHKDIEQPREDLRRALRVLPDATWLEASEVADRIGALIAMADGLGLEPDGARLVQRLPLVRAAAIAEAGEAPFAIGFARLAGTRGSRAKLKLLARSLMPPPSVLDQSTRPALAYLRHAGHLITGVPRTIRGVRRGRRQVR